MGFLKLTSTHGKVVHIAIHHIEYFFELSEEGGTCICMTSGKDLNVKESPKWIMALMERSLRRFRGD